MEATTNERDEQRPSRMLSRSFWSGFVLHMCLVCGIQDWLGKEEFLRRAESDWMNTHWLMWAFFGLIALSIYSLQQAKVSK